VALALTFRGWQEDVNNERLFIVERSSTVDGLTSVVKRDAKSGTERLSEKRHTQRFTITTTTTIIIIIIIVIIVIFHHACQYRMGAVLKTSRDWLRATQLSLTRVVLYYPQQRILISSFDSGAISREPCASCTRR
jgi:hypothetical protein